VRIEVHKIGQAVPKPSGLPVAGLPLLEAESYFVTRGKIRPVVVVSTGGIDASRFKARGSPWQTKPAVLVAPHYGVPPDGSRGGWNPGLARGSKKLSIHSTLFLPWPSTEGMRSSWSAKARSGSSLSLLLRQLLQELQLILMPLCGSLHEVRTNAVAILFGKRLD